MGKLVALDVKLKTPTMAKFLLNHHKLTQPHPIKIAKDLPAKPWIITPQMTPLPTMVMLTTHPTTQIMVVMVIVWMQLIALATTVVTLMKLPTINQTEPHRNLDVMVEHVLVQKKSKDLKLNRSLRVHVEMESATNHVSQNCQTNQIDNLIHLLHLWIALNLVLVETLKMLQWKH